MGSGLRNMSVWASRPPFFWGRVTGTSLLPLGFDGPQAAGSPSVPRRRAGMASAQTQRVPRALCTLCTPLSMPQPQVTPTSSLVSELPSDGHLARVPWAAGLGAEGPATFPPDSLLSKASTWSSRLLGLEAGPRSRQSEGASVQGRKRLTGLRPPRGRDGMAALEGQGNVARPRYGAPRASPHPLERAGPSPSRAGPRGPGAALGKP